MTIQEHVPLSEHTTLRLGGKARYYADASSIQDVREALTYARDASLPVHTLGAGSNTLFRDTGFPGLVLHIAIMGRSYEEAPQGDARLIAGAGEDWDTLVEETVRHGYWGLENLSAIPGTVGAAPIQNIGAYGVEVAERIEWVEVLDVHTHELSVLTVAECGFGYRDSLFKTSEGRHLTVIRVAFRLSTHASPKILYKDLAMYLASAKHETITPSDVRSAVMDIRARKLPDPHTIGTAGSYFKNPTVTSEEKKRLELLLGPLPTYERDDGCHTVPAAWLLERFGWKGKRTDTVGCWERQPLCIVHYGNGTAQDLISFSEAIQHDIHERTGITLEPEVCTIPA